MLLNELELVEGDYGLLQASELLNKADRTLLYGFTCDRDTWHVYLLGGLIFTCSYAFKQEPKEIGVHDNHDYVPNKRLYPARCDFEFCSKLKSRGVHLPFTSFDAKELDSFEKFPYYGKLLTVTANTAIA